MCLYLKKNPITTEAYIMEINRIETVIVLTKFNLEIVIIFLFYYYNFS